MSRVYAVLFLFAVSVIAISPSLTNCLEEDSNSISFEISELNERIVEEEDAMWDLDSLKRHHHHDHHHAHPPHHGHHAHPPHHGHHGHPPHHGHHAHPPHHGHHSHHHHHAPPPEGF
ncbi:hypothetical protein ABFS82_07G033000 [Erythranthe guttata]